MKTNNAFKHIPEHMFEALELYESDALLWCLDESGEYLEVTYPDKQIIVTPKGYTICLAETYTNKEGDKYTIYEPADTHRFVCNASVQLLLDELFRGHFATR